MRKCAVMILIILGVHVFGAYAETQFGYISCSTYNIGDDIQSVAARRFLPANVVPIDREFVGVFNSKQIVPTIVNGWFMHTKDIAWYRTDIPAPQKSWPPSPSIDPLFVSIHLMPDFMKTALSPESVEYLKQYAPIGARDYTTLHELQNHGVPSYFSGCLTLTLNNEYTKRNNIVYLVDVDPECAAYVRSKTHASIKTVTHVTNVFPLLNAQQRLRYAEDFIKKYSQAKCVVTTRLHAAMPCLGLGTPVLLIVPRTNTRFHGLRELARHCEREELLSGKVEFDFDNPPENPKDYLALRKKLIQTVSEWVAKKAK